MATVTGGGATNVLNVGSNDANGIATTLAAQLSTSLQNGSLVREPPGQNPSVGGGLTAILTAGTYQVAPADSAIVVGDNANSVILGSGASNTQVLIGASSVAFNTNGGSGVLVSGDLPQLIATPTTGGGSFTFTTGTGSDIILAVSGFNTVNAGGGTNVIFTGGAVDVINSQGADIINGAIGGKAGLTDTVNAGGAGTSTFIAEGPKNLLYNGGAGATTILASQGTDTINLGSGGGLVAGGSAGNNRISTGFTGSAIVFGGGQNDILTINGSGSNTLVAAAGNETLTGAGATGNNVFYTGSGMDRIYAGSGSDTIFAGSGNSTVSAGAGADLVAIVNGRAGGNVAINGFRPANGDHVTLQGYGANEVANDVASAVVTPATGSAIGFTTVTLSDNTKITFNGVTNLNTSNFV